MIVPPPAHDLTDNRQLVMAARFDRLAGFARRAGWADEARFLVDHAAELRKTDLERAWPLGRCDWCWIIFNRLTEATMLDESMPICDRCNDEAAAARHTGGHEQ